MQTVISAFKDQATAQSAMERLIESGFSRQNVHLEAGQSSGVSSTTTSMDSETSSGSRDGEGIMASVGHFFSHLFGDADSTHAGTYSEAVRRGNTVVVVDVMSEEEEERAADIMEECGAVDIDKHAEEWRSSGWTGGSSGSSTAAAMAPVSGGIGRETITAAQPQSDRMQTPVDSNTTMKVVQEELQVGKRTVERGGVRIIQRMSETPVQEVVRLRSEKAIVERRPVDRAATESDFASTADGTLEIRETAEEAVIGKTARVVEEVVVGKKVDERTETVTDKVRRKDVEVEQLDEHAMASRGTGLKDTVRKDGMDPLTPTDRS